MSASYEPTSPSSLLIHKGGGKNFPHLASAVFSLGDPLTRPKKLFQESLPPQSAPMRECRLRRLGNGCRAVSRHLKVAQPSHTPSSLPLHLPLCIPAPNHCSSEPPGVTRSLGFTALLACLFLAFSASRQCVAIDVSTSFQCMVACEARPPPTSVDLMDFNSTLGFPGDHQ